MQRNNKLIVCFNLWAKKYQFPPKGYSTPLKISKNSSSRKLTTSNFSNLPNFRGFMPCIYFVQKRAELIAGKLWQLGDI